MIKKSVQTNLGFDKNKDSRPVECLGMTFETDDERRAYFIEKLREKLKDPEFRKIGGFPIGEDEDILALSDPPFYTACPNPFLENFIDHYGKPFDAKEKYHREPFAADVKEGKNNPTYNAHSYHTKVPHKAIMRYILHYTEPGDIVLDGFCGTGMTGVAAQLCGVKSEVMDLGYKINEDGSIINRDGNIFSKFGSRRTILNDLSPSASFIAYIYNTYIDSNTFKKEADKILNKLFENCGWMYTTLHHATKDLAQSLAMKLEKCDDLQDCIKLIRDKINNNKDSNLQTGSINCTVWTDVFSCNECGSEFDLWNAALDLENGSVLNEFPCPTCNALLTKRGLKHATISTFDEGLNKVITKAKVIPSLIVYKIGNKRYKKVPDEFDIALISKINSIDIESWYPTIRMPKGDESRRNDRTGSTHIHHFYTKRNLASLSFLKDLIERSPYYRQLKWQFDTNIIRQSRLSRLLVSYFFHGGGGWAGGPISGTLYIPSFSVEVQPFETWNNRTKKTAKGIKSLPEKLSIIFSSHSGHIALPDNSVDYLFIDPPFGGNIMYSELNFLWEAWLGVLTNNTTEAVTNKTQKKQLVEYQILMLECFREFFRVLKPGRWITVEFSNTQSKVWNSIQTTLQEAGFVVANVAALDKKQGSFKAVTTPTAVKQDLIISAYKPNGGLEKRFIKRADTEEGVWDFIKTHLNNLPVAKPKGGQLEFITERDPRILYDRTVAFYVRHGIPVPLSSPEFQTGLADRFPERDGMYFLPDQAAEYDKKRIKMEGLGQMAIWVEDERSAADWLRNFLKNKPSKYQEIQPEFFEKLNEAWKKWETRPELRSLLDQYFLCYDGQGNVPPRSIATCLPTLKICASFLPMILRCGQKLRTAGLFRIRVKTPMLKSLGKKGFLKSSGPTCRRDMMLRPSKDVCIVARKRFQVWNRRRQKFQKASVLNLFGPRRSGWVSNNAINIKITRPSSLWPIIYLKMSSMETISFR